MVRSWFRLTSIPSSSTFSEDINVLGQQVVHAINSDTYDAIAEACDHEWETWNKCRTCGGSMSWKRY